MRRFVAWTLLFGLTAGVASAQVAGMPVWNSPKVGSGLMVAADYGAPTTDAGGGNTWGLRAEVGFGRIGVGARYSTWEPEGAAERTSSFGAVGMFRLIGGALSPLNVNLIGGAGTTSDITTGNVTFQNITSYVAGAGASVMLPIPGFSIEPYLSVTNRWNKQSGASTTESDIGWTLGANVTFGMLGAHIAYDSQDYGGTTGSILGVGVHVGIGIPGL